MGMIRTIFSTPPHRNIFILDTENFAQFIGYKGKNYHEFMETVDLAKKAIYDEDAREILKEIAVESISVIKNDKNHLDHSTKEFVKYIKENYLK